MLLLSEVRTSEIHKLLETYGLSLTMCAIDTLIPGSFWGDEEAGLIGNRLFARPDTPVHSILHESCHFICMDQQRRSLLDTNAGGTAAEENAVCYLQILLADNLSFIDRQKMTADMDSWGYSFRLGSAMAWFQSDAEDASQWLISHRLIDKQGKVTFKLRH